MTNEKLFAMRFSKIYSLLEAKAVRKGRTPEEVQAVVTWLTGYDKADVERMLADTTTYGEFFQNAPRLNPDRKLITGKICGVRVEEITDPLMQEIRYLDKLIDELAKGRPMDKILRSQKP